MRPTSTPQGYFAPHPGSTACNASYKNLNISSYPFAPERPVLKHEPGREAATVFPSCNQNMGDFAGGDRSPFGKRSTDASPAFPWSDAEVRSKAGTWATSSQQRFLQQTSPLHGLLPFSSSSHLSATSVPSPWTAPMKTECSERSAQPGLAHKPLPEHLLESMKKQRRLEKNRESARECRKRKKERQEVLTREIQKLEFQNNQLRLQLKIGAESVKREQKEKKTVLIKLKEEIGRGASDAEINSLIHDYKEKFSDYGKDRISALDFHLKELERLALPGSTTRLCVWGMSHSNDSFLQPVNDSLARTSTEQDKQCLDTVQESQAARHIWNLICKLLELTPEQQSQVLDRKTSVLSLEEDLQQLEKMIGELRKVISNNSSALDSEMEELRRILSPTQTAKFMIWVKDNPGCMYMLNQLWSKIHPSS